MIPLETTEVKASDLKVGEKFLDEYGDLWTLKRVETKENGNLNLWFDNLEGTESFYPIGKDTIVLKVVETVNAPLGSMPDPLKSDVDGIRNIPMFSEEQPKELDLPSLSEAALVDPTVYQDEPITVAEVKVRDRIHVFQKAVNPYVGIVTSISVLTASNKIVLTFDTGATYTFDPSNTVTRSAQNCTISESKEHIGLVIATLRIDGDPDAQQAMLQYAMLIRNRKPELSHALMSLVQDLVK